MNETSATTEAIEEELHRILTARTLRKFQDDRIPDTVLEMIAKRAIEESSPADWVRRLQSDTDINEAFRYIATNILVRAAGDVPA